MIALQIAKFLLWLCAPADHADAILGDLIEECRGAGGWFLSQTIRSAVPLLVLRWRRGELAGMLATALCAILVPLRLADGLWSFVHSQVPRKTDLNWSIGFWFVDLAIAICGAWVLRLAAREMRTATIQAILGFACAAVSIVMSAGRVPAWYAIALLIAVPAACLIPTPKQRREA